MTPELSIKKEVTASVPSKYGPFELSIFTTNQDKKEHILLTCGAVENSDDILVRIHSECFTGDILGSLRCDCGEQLQLSMSKIASEGKGLIIYLRQEGRGIGLIEKLKSYNLQDQGKDTIDANLALGHKEDERSYEIASHIIKSLKIKSLRVLTNNPKKIESLMNHDLNITSRVAITGSVSPHNAFYLLTKVKKMQHMFAEDELLELFSKCASETPQIKPLVILAYAQSLDGAISYHEKKRLMLSCQESLAMTHELRSQNDAVLVGVGTIISDDPLLTVRYIKGKNPQTIILDSTLRIPISARILKNANPPIIFTTNKASPEKYNSISQMNVKIIEVDSTKDGKVNLNTVLKKLYNFGIKTLMVEGGREIITNFLNEDQVDKVIITIAPIFVGGFSALSTMNMTSNFPRLKNIIQYKLGSDLIIKGDVARNIN